MAKGYKTSRAEGRRIFRQLHDP